MLLDSDLPALKVDFLELQNSKWHASNCVGKQTSRAFQQYIIVHTLHKDRRRKLAFNASSLPNSGVQRQKRIKSWSSTPEMDPNLALNAQNSLMHVNCLNLSPAHTKWAPEVDLCIIHHSLLIFCKPRLLVQHLNNFQKLILYLMTFLDLNFVLFDGMSL